MFYRGSGRGVCRKSTSKTTIPVLVRRVCLPWKWVELCLKSASKPTINVLGRIGCFTVEVGGVCVSNQRINQQFLYWDGGMFYRGSGRGLCLKSANKPTIPVLGRRGCFTLEVDGGCVLKQRVNQQSMLLLFAFQSMFISIWVYRLEIAEFPDIVHRSAP